MLLTWLQTDIRRTDIGRAYQLEQARAFVKTTLMDPADIIPTPSSKHGHGHQVKDVVSLARSMIADEKAKRLKKQQTDPSVKVNHR